MRRSSSFRPCTQGGRALSRLRPWVVSGWALAAGGVRNRRLSTCRSLTATPILSLEDELGGGSWAIAVVSTNREKQFNRRRSGKGTGTTHHQRFTEDDTIASPASRPLFFPLRTDHLIVDGAAVNRNAAPLRSRLGSVG